MTHLIIIYALCGLAGFSDGLNDCVIALRFYSSKFWGVNWWKNKDKYGWLRREVFTFTTDGWHLTKFITPIFYAVAIALSIDANCTALQIAACFLSTRVGRWLCYDIIFKKKN